MAQVSSGAAGEILAARFLREKGYTLLASGYRSRFGEIDIIASDGPYIVFVEVKTRSQGAISLPREAVTVDKQRRLLSTAALYLKSYPCRLQPRFDVVEVWTDPVFPLKAVQIDHIVSAYEAGDLGRAF